MASTFPEIHAAVNDANSAPVLVFELGEYDETKDRPSETLNPIS
jgi:hypothetical protein